MQDREMASTLTDNCSFFPSEWQCKSCTVVNQGSSVLCEVCERPRLATRPPVAPAFSSSKSPSANAHGQVCWSLSPSFSTASSLVMAPSALCHSGFASSAPSSTPGPHWRVRCATCRVNPPPSRCRRLLKTHPRGNPE